MVTPSSSIIRLFVLFILMVGCHGASKPPEQPQPLDSKVQESVSRAMLRLQTARLNYILSAVNGATPTQIIAAQQEQQDATVGYQAMLAGFQRDYHAEGCDLKIDKTWDCSKRLPDAKR